MQSQFKIYLFGDQTCDIHEKLHALLHSNRDSALGSFFENAFQAMRTEIGQLPLRDREGLPNFSGIAELLSWRCQDEKLGLAVDMALTCIYHLGKFISEHNIDASYPSPQSSCLLGLCTGTLAAAAISSCRSISELLPLAVETVLVTFRTGLCVLDIRERVESSSVSAASWSMVVPGFTVAEALNQFCKGSNLPLTSQPYVSAYALHGLTISGPPSILKSFCESSFFPSASKKNLSISAPFHAAHLFSQEDIEDVLRATSVETWARYKAYIPFLSSTTGALVEGNDYRSLLKAALAQILLEPIRWDPIIKGLSTVLQRSGSSEFQVIPFGTTAQQTIYSALTNSSTAGLPRIWPGQGQDLPWKIPESHAGTIGRSKIAILGMSGRFPSAQDNDAFWELLHEGLDVHREVPALHWDTKTHVDTTGKKKNTSATPYGCWLDNPAAFDSRFFNMSPREAPQVDPAQRIALMTAYEAIEQAGLVPDATPSTKKDRVGVFYGVTSNDWMETNSAQNIDTYFIPGGNRAFIPGRLNYFFKFSGPSVCVDTACSSSLAAINIACNSLWNGDIDTAIAGGTNVLTNPDFTSGLDRGHFLSRTGNCRTFDDTADGYCRGEGVGSVVLKRLEDAIRDHDPIQGLILGAYTNHSAEAESITRPHVGAQRAIFKKILNESGIDPYSISYVEMHGTGTQAGDAGEMQSVLDTFAPTSRRPRSKDERLYLGSAKANIGHGEAASGVTSLAKVLLMMQNDLIPPHAGIKTKINHRFPSDLEERNVHIALKPVSWNRNDSKSKIRRVFLNNFSAAGGNTALLLEDAPSIQPTDDIEDHRSRHMIAVSAKCPASLKGNLASMIDFLRKQEMTALGRLSYTTTARRMHHQHRVMVTGSDVADITARLETAVIDQTGMTRPKSAPKVVFTFTGQGVQFAGMGRQLLDSFSQFRADIRRFDKIGQKLGFPSILPIFEAGTDSDISDFSPVVVQLASVCMQMAMSELWASWGIVPHAVVGHSLGEYAALNVSKVLSAADTIYLVGKRAELLQEKCAQNTHSMLVVKASKDAVAEELEGIEYELACINSPTEVVLSGPNDTIYKFQKILTNRGLKSTILKIPYAFHSSQVDPILDAFEELAQGITFHKPMIPVICPLSGNVTTEVGIFGPSYLARHCREPVNMLNALLFAQSHHIITKKAFIIEIGPHPAISGMVKATIGSEVTVLSILQRNRDCWPGLTGALTALYCAAAEINWAEYHRDFVSSHSVVQQLPAYSWDLKDYWIQYVNDWSLRKGEPPLLLNSALKLESTTIHRVLDESSIADKVSLIIESDIARPDLNPLVQGHRVNGVPLCTPSVYADIALTLGVYLLDRYQPNMEERLINISDMTILKALISKPQGPQLLQTIASVDWSTKSIALRFCTLDHKDLPTVEHARCVVRFTDMSRKQASTATAPVFKQRMQALRKGITEETAARFNRAMVYKMIYALAQFHEDYKAIDEVVLRSETLEASSRVSFRDVKKGGNFHTHPAFIDGLTQSSGFAMNCNDAANLETEVFVNHGWKSFQLFEEISGDKEYTTYTQMKEGKDRMWEGDIIVFHGDDVVALFEGIVLQGVPRRVLHYILSVESGQKPQARVANQAKNHLPTASSEASKIQSLPSREQPVIENHTRISLALQIISEESGVAVSDLSDDSSFADMGIDSLLSLTIVSRFREEFDIDVNDSDSMFMDYPTVKDIKTFLAPAEGSAKPSTEPQHSNPELGVMTSSIAHEQPSTPLTADLDFQPVLQIISEESGVAASDLTDDCSFADVGVDSLLSLIVLSRLREELAMEVEIESLFVDCPTVGSLRDFFLKKAPSEAETSTTRSENLRALSSGPESMVSDGKGTPLSPSLASSPISSFDQVLESRHVRSATSVVLQGIPKNCQKTLFLFPDGSGSSTSYGSIPRIESNTAVYGLNSPYLKAPKEMTACTINDLVEGYLIEIRRRQPNGPYDFGGWSAGGILAYHAAQTLIEEGEEVLNLILIDSPAPKGLDRLPQHFYDFCESLNLFGHSAGGIVKAKPEWLIPHFNATIDVLHDYWAEPLSEGQQIPKVSIIWACESVIGGDVPKLAPSPDDTDGMKFLTEKRTDFSSNGWEDLFPNGEVSIERELGANHFSMMRGDHAANLARFIARAMD